MNWIKEEDKREEVVLIIEGEGRPFAAEIKKLLQKSGKVVKKENSSQDFLDSEAKNKHDRLVIICDIPYRTQSADVERFKMLALNYRQVLIFYLVSDEYSELQLIDAKNVKEATLHRTQGNSISLKDMVVIYDQISEMFANKRSFRQVLWSMFQSNTYTPKIVCGGIILVAVYLFISSK